MYRNLLAAMAQKGVSIEAIAKLLSVHRNTVSNKLNGESEFTFEQATLICDALFPEYKPSFIFRRSFEHESIEMMRGTSSTY